MVHEPTCFMFLKNFMDIFDEVCGRVRVDIGNSCDLRLATQNCKFAPFPFATLSRVETSAAKQHKLVYFYTVH